MLKFFYQNLVFDIKYVIKMKIILYLSMIVEHLWHKKNYEKLY